MKLAKAVTNQIVNRFYENKYNKSLFSEEEIRPVVLKNRETLSIIHNWIEEDVYENSLFGYGLPRQCRHQINKPINNEVTYTDTICYMQRKLRRPINYLELGVSVGKNFFQIANYLDNSALTGFELEEINPLLEKQFSDKETKEKWGTWSSSMKCEDSSLTHYKFGSNRIRYVSGDVFDNNSWARLRGEKFNLIFSDAFHSPYAIEFEYSMLKKHKLLDPSGFVMIWDDLGGSMTKPFLKIYNDLKLIYGLEARNVALNRYRGWFGQHEGKHLVGIVMFSGI